MKHMMWQRAAPLKMFEVGVWAQTYWYTNPLTYPSPFLSEFIFIWIFLRTKNFLWKSDIVWGFVGNHIVWKNPGIGVIKCCSLSIVVHHELFIAFEKMNPFMVFLTFLMSCQVIAAHRNFTKCTFEEALCGSTCFNNKKMCHCGSQTFGENDGKICCLSDSSYCFTDSDGKLSKITQNCNFQTWILWC